MSRAAQRKYKRFDTQQLAWGALNLEKLVPPDDPARVIWELTGKLDLSPFEAKIKTFEGQAGSPAWPPRLLLSVWLYAYQQGISSANQLSQMMEWNPGLMVLTGLQTINVHTLCDFRAAHGEALDGLLRQLLSALSEEGLVDFSTIVQDGTKMQARAGQSSGHRRGRLEEKLEQAKAYMEKVDQQSEEGATARQQAARERAARERVQRLERAFQEAERAAEKDPQRRVSISEPEAKRMRHSQDGSCSYSYNVQLSTEAANNFIVGVAVTQDHNDRKQLQPAIEMVQHFTGQTPQCVIADGGYVTRGNIQALAESGIELIAPVQKQQRRYAGLRARYGVAPEFDASRFTTRPDGQLECPAGNTLVVIGQKKHHGQRTRTFAANAAACAACQHKPSCCPNMPARHIHQVLESAAIGAHQARMETERAKQLYRLRSKIAEFPHMRIKSDWGLRRFSVRGLGKVMSEMLLIVLAYNFSQWQWTLKHRSTPA